MGKNLEDYLAQFGYLPQSNLETGAMRSEKQLRDAISNLQFFAGLNVTGYVDDNTAQLLSRPRCGVPDVSHANYRNRRSRVRRYNLQGQRWPHTNLTWSLRKPQSMLDINDIRRELSYALDMWARESALTFVEVAPDDSTADIQVFFHRGYHNDGYPFDGAGLVLAHAFFPGGGRGGDAHFDDEEDWTADDRAVSKYRASVFAVAVHEFGHSLGLSHSAAEGSLMYPWYSTEMMENNYRLPKDDRVAIQHLYGKKEEEEQLVEEEKQKTPGRPKVTFPQDDRNVVPTNVEPSTTTTPPPSPPTTTTATSSSSFEVLPPDKCQTDFDAVAVIRSEMWAFKSRYFWRINRDGGTRGDPVELEAFWYGLPPNIDHVDAVYERPDHKIVFFVGLFFYVLAGNSQLEQGPMPLSYLGLPLTLQKVDAAMRWGYNGHTYFFSGSMYWRFDESIQRVELDYPRDISMWKGVRGSVDAAFQYTDGKTYFFLGKHFWEFDDARMRVVNPDPTPVGEHWMHCPKEIQDPFQSGHLSDSDSNSGWAALILPLAIATTAKNCLSSALL